MSTAPKVPVRERLDPEVRRERIIETAMAILSEEGYRGLSMRAVARRCGMSAPGVMHHFPTLPTLLMAVLDYRDMRDVRELVPQLNETSTGRELMNLIIARMARNPGEAQLFAMLEAESLDPAHPAHHYFKERHARGVAYLEHFLADDFDDPYGAARRLLAILDGLQLHWLQDPEHFDLQEQWAPIADALFGQAPRDKRS